MQAGDHDGGIESQNFFHPRICGERADRGGTRQHAVNYRSDCLTGFMAHIGRDEIAPVCEMAPGTVLSEIDIGNRTFAVITKSGVSEAKP